MSTRISDKEIDKLWDWYDEVDPSGETLFEIIVAEAQRKHSDREEAQSMINRANAGLDALTERADPYWKGYWKGVKDYGQAKLKEIEEL